MKGVTDIYYCPRCLHVFTEGHHLCDASGPGATIIGKLSKDLPKVGDLFAGRYLLSELVARGGMGAVFKGTHNGQIFAIKVVKPACVASVRRFLKQAQAVSKIKHPSIVDISSWGISDSGHVYQVMEYLEGQTLAKTLAASGALGLPKALDLLITLASALDVVHGFDVLHLDLKPENIFLTKDGTVKLLDFLGAQDDLAPNFTEILGTPAYMSPEQALGDAVGSSADVYSLGVVFYEMLTGELPFAYERHSSKPSGVLDLPSMDIPFAARQKLLELLNLMTLDLPSKRPSAKEIAELAKSIDLQSTAYVANNMLGNLNYEPTVRYEQDAPLLKGNIITRHAASDVPNENDQPIVISLVDIELRSFGPDTGVQSARGMFAPEREMFLEQVKRFGGFLAINEADRIRIAFGLNRREDAPWEHAVLVAAQFQQRLMRFVAAMGVPVSAAISVVTDYVFVPFGTMPALDVAVQGPIAEKVADLSKQAQSCQVLFDDRTKRRIGEKHGLQNPELLAVLRQNTG